MHVGVGAIGPDFGEVGVGELSEVGFNAIVVEDCVDGGVTPVGFEDEAGRRIGSFWKWRRMPRSWRKRLRVAISLLSWMSWRRQVIS